MKKRFKNLSKKKNKVLDIDITSLLDILVILLVFLLKNYNASDLKIDLVKGITLPGSSSQKLGNHSVIVMVNRQKQVFVNNKPIGYVDKNSETIAPLLSKLREIKNDYDINKRVPANTKNQANLKENPKEKVLKKVNIVLDKELPYNVLRKVMHSAATAGYQDFKFIVKGNYD